MKIKEIIRRITQLLSLEVHENDLTDDVVESTDETINMLLDCTNMAITETLSGHIRLYKTETLTTDDGKIYYDTLKEAIFEPISVFTSKGRTKFESHPEYIETVSGEVVFTYSYLPKPSKLNDTLPLPPSVTVNLLAYKAASIYGIRKGLYDTAVYYDKQYKDSLGSSIVGRRYRPMPKYYGG